MAEMKKFVSEAEIEEKRKKRQEEWEKVRQPHQPKEVPEEPVDTRSLYEQLQAQKDQKQLDFDEQHRMRNQVRGIDKEEADFLDFVVERQQEIEKEKHLEENEVLQEFRSSVANRTVSAPSKGEEKGTGDKSTVALSKKRTSQAELLSGAVKKKRSDDVKTESQESKTNSGSIPESTIQEAVVSSASTTKSRPTSTSDSSGSEDLQIERTRDVAWVAGILPGIGVYTDSDNSDTSSSDSEIDTDLLRRDLGTKSSHDAGSHKHR